MSKKVKVGIWGLGRAGRGMHTSEIQVHSDKLEIVAACDIDPERAKAYGEAHKNVKIYTDPAKFLIPISACAVLGSCFTVEMGNMIEFKK